MTIDSADQNLELYPFPSVTICSQNKISKSKLEKLLHNPRYGEFTFEQMAFIMSVMSQVHEAQNRAQDLIRINQMLDNNGIATQEIIDIINQVNNVFFISIKYCKILSLPYCRYRLNVMKYCWFVNGKKIQFPVRNCLLVD